MSDDSTNDRDRAFIDYLREVRAKGFFWPTEEVLREVHATVAQYATELVITRKRPGGTEILLTVYQGGVQEFLGLWHLPGGYGRWNESISETCVRIASRELNAKVSVNGVLDAEKWMPSEHPYGMPLSVYVHCQLSSTFLESNEIRFFPVHELPEKTMVQPHLRFLQKKGNF